MTSDQIKLNLFNNTIYLIYLSFGKNFPLIYVRKQKQKQKLSVHSLATQNSTWDKIPSVIPFYAEELSEPRFE